MPFQDQAESVASRLHLQRIPRAAFCGLCAVFVVAMGFAVFQFVKPMGVFEVEAAPASMEQADSSAESEGLAVSESDAALEMGTSAPGREAAGSALICVHVDGAVATPGVYYLADGSRVADALAAAGGTAENGCTAAVNMAQRLQDGQQVVVPTVEEASSGTVPSAAASGLDVPSPAGESRSGLVSINRASVEELQTLSGIGAATARKIVADREQNGPFASLEDLMRVSGIGEKKFAALKDSLCL